MLKRYGFHYFLYILLETVSIYDRGYLKYKINELVTLCNAIFSRLAL
jgi:hypothetical protein